MNEQQQSITLERLVAMCVIGILGILIMPLPAVAMDLLLAMNVGDNACARHLGLVVHAPRGEHGRHVVHGLVLLKRQLGVRMKVPPNAHPFRVMRCRQGLDASKKAHGKRVGLSWVHA